MKDIIYAHTGEVKEGYSNVVLKSGAVGSCIVIVAYNEEFKIGTMAHILLPGKAPERRNIVSTRYAHNAVHELLKVFLDKKIQLNDIDICIVGGANVLNRSNDEICKLNVNSVHELLKESGIKVAARSLGGTLRRSVSLDIETGRLYLSVGDQEEKIFLTFEK
jgi:chemotaxis protein CheD